MPDPSIKAILKSTDDEVLPALLADSLFLVKTTQFLGTESHDTLLLTVGPASLFLAGLLRPTHPRLVAEIQPGSFAGWTDANVARVLVVTDVLRDDDDPMQAWKTYLRSTNLPRGLNVPVDVRCVVDRRTEEWLPPSPKSIEARGINLVVAMSEDR